MLTKKVIYDNYEIYSQENKLISLVSKSKYDWYIKKGIVDVLSEKAIRLRFKPNYRDMEERTYIIRRDNKCYVCNSEFDLISFNVFPTEYKRFMPKHIRVINVFNMIPQCKECTSHADRMYQKKKIDLQKLYQIEKFSFIDDTKYRLKRCRTQYKNIK